MKGKELPLKRESRESNTRSSAMMDGCEFKTVASHPYSIHSSPQTQLFLNAHKIFPLHVNAMLLIVPFAVLPLSSGVLALITALHLIC